jgi:hypothetical protein
MLKTTSSVRRTYCKVRESLLNPLDLARVQAVLLLPRRLTSVVLTMNTVVKYHGCKQTSDSVQSTGRPTSEAASSKSGNRLFTANCQL